MEKSNGKILQVTFDKDMTNDKIEVDLGLRKGSIKILWKEKNIVMNNFKINDLAKVVGNTTYHEFEIGTVVEILYHRDADGDYKVYGKIGGGHNGWCYVNENSLEPIPEKRVDNIIIYKDSFVWRDVSDIAMQLYRIIDLYLLNVSEETESLIESAEEIKEALDNNQIIAIEVGHLRPSER